VDVRSRSSQSWILTERVKCTLLSVFPHLCMCCVYVHVSM
jgi:hypothetical protein